MKIAKRVIKVAAFCVAIGLCGFAFWWGRIVPFSEQWPAYDALRQTAAIILGVLGVWIAVLHPQAVSQVLSWKEHSAQVKRLVFPMLVCTGVVGATLLVGIAAPAAKHCTMLTPHTSLLRGTSFGTLVVTTFLLIWSLLATLTGLDDMKDDTEARALQERSTKNMLPTSYKPSSPG